jgi:hypothetical protein
MGFRFRKSIKLLPGVRVNISKGGASLSVGGRGATANISKRGVRTTVGIPGTGFSYTAQPVKYNTSKNTTATPPTVQAGSDNVALQLAITLIIMGAIGATVHQCAPSKAVIAESEVIATPVKPEESRAINFKKPTWCRKAKTTVELMVCGDSDLSESAVALDNLWDDYKATQPKADIAKARAYLRSWNKDIFQACDSSPNMNLCIAQAYGVVLNHKLLSPVKKN